MYTRSLMSYLTQMGQPHSSLLVAGSLTVRPAVDASVATGCCDGVPTGDRLRLSLLQPPSPGASGEAWRGCEGFARSTHGCITKMNTTDSKSNLSCGQTGGRMERRGSLFAAFSSGADANRKPSETDGAAPARRHSGRPLPVEPARLQP